ncbi:MAG: alpha/beta hydrolase [Chloroflexota bacterium]
MHTTETGFILLENDAKLYYETQGAGTPLLLLHAGIADTRMWAGQLDTFAEHYRVICYDFRGYGQSPLTAGTFANHDDVAAVLDHFEIDEAHILGISFGGRTALDFTLTYPERVKSLILGAPSVSGASSSTRQDAVDEQEDALLEAGDFAGATELMLEVWVDGPHRKPEQIDPAVRNLVYEMQMDAFLVPEPDDLTIVGLDKPAIGRLDEVRVPTLVVIGDLDVKDKVALAGRLADEIADAQLVTMTGVAHMLNMEQPEVFNEAVLAFLQKIS